MGLAIPPLMPGEGCIDAVVDSANLAPGRYLGSPWVASFGVGDYDIVPHAVVLDVDSADVYKSGRGLQPGEGIVYLNCRWQPNHDLAVSISA
jgi:hypothetical protein